MLITNADGNNVTIVCDGNQVNQGFFNMFNKIEHWPTTDIMFLLFDLFNY